VQIMTGAPVPDGCETIIPIENVELEQGENGDIIAIRLKAPLAAGRHIRRAGEDVKAGQTLLSPGRRISAEDVMMLSALGLQTVTVMVRPKVSLISTGAELIDDPKIPLQPGQIRNSNQPYLSASLQNWPVEVEKINGHPDTQDAFLVFLNEAISNGSHMIISTGAVSMGVRDFVPDALRAIGARIVFHKCRIRPGKPVLFAVLPNGCLYFGLPGNPVSSAVGFAFFALPALRRLLAVGDQPLVLAKLDKAFSKRADLRMFAKAVFRVVDGQTKLTILPGQQSFRMKPWIEANCWAELPEDQAEFAAGEPLAVHLFPGAVI